MQELGDHISQATGATASVRLGELMLETTGDKLVALLTFCLLYTSPSPRD